MAWVKVTQKKRLRVVNLDVDRTPELADHLDVRQTPSLLLLENGAVVGRLEGRATGRQIDALIGPHLREEHEMTANDEKLDSEDSVGTAGRDDDRADRVPPEERQPPSEEKGAQDNYANADEKT